MWRKAVIGGTIVTATAVLLFIVASHFTSLRWQHSFGGLHFVEFEAYKGELAVRYGSYFHGAAGDLGETRTSGFPGWITFSSNLVVYDPYELPPPPPGRKWHRRVGTLLVNMWLLVGLAAVVPATWLGACAARRRIRRARQQCVRCGYDLRGNTSGACPECGLPPGERVGEAAPTDHAIRGHQSTQRSGQLPVSERRASAEDK
jgi:hypothetical protein